MKKILCFLFSLVIVFGLASPADATTAESRESYITEQNELSEAIPFKCDVVVMDAGILPYISITYDCESVTTDTVDEFGQIIYFTKEYCDKTFKQYELRVYIHDLERGSTPLTWGSNYIHYGTLSDNRDGKRVETRIDNLKDLCAYFPALEQAINPSDSTSGLSRISVGSSSAAPSFSVTEPITVPTTVPETTEQTGQWFIVNKSTMKFHSTGCSYAPDESSKNYSLVNSTKESLEQKGYEPCKKCLK